MASFGVVGLSLSFLPFSDFLAFLQELQVDGFELATLPQAFRGELDLTSEAGREWVREKVRASGLRILSLGGYNSFTVPKDQLPQEVERLAGYMRIAADLGIPVVRAMGGELPAGWSKEEAMTALVEGFRRAVAVAADLGLVLALENHGHFLQDASILRELVEKVDAPQLRLTLDTGNFCWAGRSIAQAASYYRELLPYVASVHLKDGRPYPKEGQPHETAFKFTPVGSGDLAPYLAELLQELARRDYAGPVQIEFEGAGDPRTLFDKADPEVVEFVKEGTRAGVAWVRQSWPA
ncbi:MAG: sugar phosphate isomerase/epimerase [Limnochordales bacterium]|nr:sugar phosphate isomerase/epimerase [Limnochordales bacterium]